MKAFITDSTYKTQDDKTKVFIYGKLENGKSFVSIHDFEPHFFIASSDIKKIEKYLKKFKTSETDLKTFTDKKVTKISHSSQTELNKLEKQAHKIIDTYEGDIKPDKRFLLDNNILSNLEILSSDFESSEKVDCIFTNPTIKPLSEFKPNLKIASIDIESSHESGDLYCIGIYSENYQKNFYINNKTIKHKDAVQCKSEIECLEKFKSALINLDPDIITGWNVIDFDLSVLKNKFEENSLSFDLGRDNSTSRLRLQSGFFQSSTANLSGRIVLDALNLIRDPFIKEAPTIKSVNFDSYSLESVSQAILKEGKEIKGSGKERHEEISSSWTSNPKKIISYNLKDCKLVFDILKKTDLIVLAIERSQMTGMPLDRITASIASFDSLYIKEARSKKLVSPTNRYKPKEERITGGYVQDSKPGIYNSVLVLDFKSLYPSIIKTFNIDPSSFVEEPKGEKTKLIESPNKAYFKNSQGILPEIISKLHKEREKAKKENRELASYAIKIIMNSFFGVLASPNCRYFSLDMANAITHFGQHIIKLTAKEIESSFKLKTIYSDTDSVFVDTNLENKEEANKLGIKIQTHINSFYQNYVKNDYKRDSFLELEFEKLYLSMMIPKVRGKSEAGAKKRYAGLLEKAGKEKIEITGLEAIRGDWTEAAQDFQIQLLDKVFHKKEISKFILSYISDLKKGKLDKKLVYKKSIRKSLDEYTKTTPPHVKAARKLQTLDSNIIKYYITSDGPEPIQNLKHSLDYEHYIDKQIKPIAQQVLTLFNKDFSDVLAGDKQAKLF